MKLKKILEESNAPGYKDRKFGAPLPTLASVQAAYNAKQGKLAEAKTVLIFKKDWELEIGEDVLDFTKGDRIEGYPIKVKGGKVHWTYEDGEEAIVPKNVVKIVKESITEKNLKEGIQSNIMQKWGDEKTIFRDLKEFIDNAADAGGLDLVVDIHSALKLAAQYASNKR